MIIEEVENTQTTQVDPQILNFLDYVVLMLSQARSAEELDLIMDDFMSDDIIEVIHNNKELFSVLSVVWLDTIERICMRGEDHNFSLKILWLPIIFKQFDWRIEDKNRLRDLHTEATKNASEAETLYPYLILLFIEGIYLDTDKALANFEKQVRSIAKTEEDNENLDQLISDIMSLGWSH